MDRLLPSEVRLVASQHEMLRARRRPAGSRWLPQAPPLRPRPARGGGPRPHAGLKARRLLRHRRVGDLPSPCWYPSLAGRRLMRSLPIWTSPTARDRGPRPRRAGQRTAEIKLPRFGSPGVGNVVRVVFELGGPVDRSFRHRGQVLVVVGAARGRHRGCPRPDRGGRPDQHGGSDTRACAGRRWPRVRRAATPQHPGRLVPGMATIPPETSAPSRQTDPTSAMATRTRTGQVGRTSPARGRASPQGKASSARASSTRVGTVALSRNVPGSQQRGRLSFMEGSQERGEPLDRVHDLSSLSGEVEAVAEGDRSMQQCPSDNESEAGKRPRRWSRGHCSSSAPGPLPSLAVASMIAHVGGGVDGWDGTGDEVRQKRGPPHRLPGRRPGVERLGARPAIRVPRGALLGRTAGSGS